MEEVFDELETTVISEMASGANTLVPLSQQQIEEAAGDDPDPKFQTFIIESGWSRSKRYYGPQVMESISEQVNNSADPVVGYKGHISPDRAPYDFPDIQFRWIKSKMQVSGEKVKLLVKAYLLPGTKAREYAERGIKVPISIRGDAEQRPIKGGVEVRNFDLESIDMARPRKAGMGGRPVALTSEMEGGSTEVDSKEIAALSYDELKTHNPLLVEKIESDARKDLEGKVSEMETKDEESKKTIDLISKLRKLLGIDDEADVLEVVGMTLAELKKQTGKAREAILDGVLKSRFKDETHRSLVRRLVVSEMADAEIPDGDSDAAKLKVTEMVNTFIDADPQLKELASEMTDGGGANPPGGDEPDRDGDKNREIKPGFENDRISVRKVTV